MLNLVVAGIWAWLNLSKSAELQLQPLEIISWQDSLIFEIPTSQTSVVTEKNIQVYLQNLTQNGIPSDRQGIWIQSGWHSLASNQGTTPLPAASLTKIATTLVALDHWGAKHQLVTKIYSTGKIEEGVITGDLIVEGNGDPLLVWEEAIAIGNTLNRLGINSIQGDLLVTEQFYMNYQRQPQKSGELFKQALNHQQWQPEITQQYLQMPEATPQPQVAIAGEVRLVEAIPSQSRLLLSHQSLPMAEILRQMNIYSNNQMAQMLADLLGSAKEIATTAAAVADFPAAEIQLINGSGLGEANLISPRAVCQMLIAIDRLLKSSAMTAADLFPTAGKDLVGTTKDRGFPPGISVKTGTLDNVSALAGVIPTRDREHIYFSMINYGHQYQYFRQQQDLLLNELVKEWQLIPTDFNLAQEPIWFLGDPRRNELNSQQ